MQFFKPKNSSAGAKQSFIMLIGDEGAILIQLQGKQVIKRVFAAQPEKDQLRTMNELLNSSLKAPLTVLVDMMDQSYVRQTLPPVSSFNVSKIVRRRLNKDFSNDDIKGYLILGREKSGRKDWNYLMASLANPPSLQKWIDFAVERPNPFKGIGLVPLECQPLIQAVEDTYQLKMDKGTRLPEWHILVSHHKVGGFRQVVLKNRQLVFTRLAQMVGEPTPEVIAGNIEQELLNTFEYLKRLGLQDPHMLAATIVASADIKETFESKIIPTNQCHFFTPYELAAQLGVAELAKPEDHFGDVVIAGLIGRRRKMLMPLFTSYTRKLASMSRYILITRVAAIVALLGIFGWAGMTAMDWYNTTLATEDLRSSLSSLNAQFAKESEKKKTLPEKMNYYTDVATLFRTFYKSPLDPLYFVHSLPEGLEDLALIKNYHWTLSQAIPNMKNEDNRQITAEIETVLLTPQEPRKLFVANAQRLVENIKKTYSDYDVNNSDLPGVLSDKKELKILINDADSATQQTEVSSNVVKFMIKGPVANTPGQSKTAVPASPSFLKMH